MKKIFLYTFLMALFILVSNEATKSQDAIKVWTQPSAFNITEDVTIYVDVKGTPLESVIATGDVYMWSWGNGFSGTNGDWNNSDESAKWDKKPGTTIAYKKFSPITQVWPDLIDGGTISFLLKAKDGTGDIKTGDIIFKLPDWKTPAGAGILTTYPAKFTGTENVSILINVANAWNEGGTAQGQLIGGPVAAHSGVNTWQNVVESTAPKAQLVDMGNNIWRLDMIPSEYYGYTDDITEINMLFNKGGDWGASGRDVGGANFLIEVTVPVTETETPAQMFPSVATGLDVITYIFDTRLMDKQILYGKTALMLKDPQFGERVSTATGTALDLVSIGNGKFRITLIPKVYFEMSEEEVNSGGKISLKITDGVDESSTYEFTLKAK
jgi:hypothetical protein